MMRLIHGMNLSNPHTNADSSCSLYYCRATYSVTLISKGPLTRLLYLTHWE